MKQSDIEKYVKEYSIAGTTPTLAFIKTFGLGECHTSEFVEKANDFHNSKPVQKKLKKLS
jgi:hypothetical protein